MECLPKSFGERRRVGRLIRLPSSGCDGCRVPEWATSDVTCVPAIAVPPAVVAGVGRCGAGKVDALRQELRASAQTNLPTWLGLSGVSPYGHSSGHEVAVAVPRTTNNHGTGGRRLLTVVVCHLAKGVCASASPSAHRRRVRHCRRLACAQREGHYSGWTRDTEGTGQDRSSRAMSRVETPHEQASRNVTSL